MGMDREDYFVGIFSAYFECYVVVSLVDMCFLVVIYGYFCYIGRKITILYRGVGPNDYDIT